MDLIIDSGAVIAAPQMLSQGGDSVRFYLPQAAYDELRKGRFASRVAELLGRAAKAGRLTVLPTSTAQFGLALPVAGLSSADLQILQTALDFKKAHLTSDVFLVSDDQPLIRLAVSLGLQTVTSDTVEDLIQSKSAGAQSSQDVLEAATSLSRDDRNYLLRGFLLGVLVTCLFALAWTYRQWIVDAFPVWGLSLSGLFVGVALFLFRSRRRLAYGVVEVLVGTLTILPFAKPAAYDFSILIPFAACAYIVVRGMDNIQKGIEHTRAERIWRRIFGGTR